MQEGEENRSYLGHLERNDLGVVAGLEGDLAVVAAKDACTRGVDTVVRDALGAELGLIPSEGDAGGVAAVVTRSVGGERAPAAADVEETVLGCQGEFLANDLRGK